MKISQYIQLMGIALTILTLVACEDWVEVDDQNTMIVSNQVFSNDESAKSAMQGIYNHLYEASFSAGWLESVSVLCELSSDNLEPIHSNDLELMEFQNNELHSNNNRNQTFWGRASHIIYMTTALRDGLAKSTQITPEVAKRLEGETRFVRAFTYFYLLNLYGDVPLVLTTDYTVNALIMKTQSAEVYQQILDDLNASMELLGTEYIEGERTHVNQYVAEALLARVHLYLGNWGLAETYSSEVIAQTAAYNLVDYDQIFLANSQEAIWQISPLGAGGVSTNTNEGEVFIIYPLWPTLSSLKLSTNFVNSFEANDERRMHWVNYNEDIEAFYAFKYKIQSSIDVPVEYSMVLRLAEQYLIRAETRAQQNNLSGAIADLDRVRERAGLDLLSIINPGISKEALLQKILIERRHELFAEWGHRWFDLIRTGKAEEILAPSSPDWQDTDKLYPIPEEELINNHNLSQNPGY